MSKSLLRASSSLRAAGAKTLSVVEVQTGHEIDRNLSQVRDLKCWECNLSFSTQEELMNHKEKFCTNSVYNDPVALARRLAREEAKAKDDDTSRIMSFEEVRHYLRGHGVESDEGQIGPANLSTLRKRFQSDAREMDILKKEIKRKQELEKAEQLRKLKIGYQQMRAVKVQEDNEIVKLMEELEKKKESALRHRFDKEKARVI